ncbi:hypothetical protein Bhyg_02539 [Pseudolycoriella hygida]|uniref:Uncharacterized protein n=1 Tax=Pseudolycoriella hygida TaxID=35572 RepID=A0A9Q0S6L6_9DIPT|nr:hypothetical protein Bhyg_02539 [Pseudolycoriella hygida]
MKGRLRASNAEVSKWERFYTERYYERLFEDASNPKRTWQKIGRKKKSSNITVINYEDKP